MFVMISAEAIDGRTRVGDGQAGALEDGLRRVLHRRGVERVHLEQAELALDVLRRRPHVGRLERDVHEPEGLVGRRHLDPELRHAGHGHVALDRRSDVGRELRLHVVDVGVAPHREGGVSHGRAPPRWRRARPRPGRAERWAVGSGERAAAAAAATCAAGAGTAGTEASTPLRAGAATAAAAAGGVGRGVEPRRRGRLGHAALAPVAHGHADALAVDQVLRPDVVGRDGAADRAGAERERRVPARRVAHGAEQRALVDADAVGGHRGVAADDGLLVGVDRRRVAVAAVLQQRVRRPQRLVLARRDVPLEDRAQAARARAGGRRPTPAGRTTSTRVVGGTREPGHRRRGRGPTGRRCRR